MTATATLSGTSSLKLKELTEFTIIAKLFCVTKTDSSKLGDDVTYHRNPKVIDPEKGEEEAIASDITELTCKVLGARNMTGLDVSAAMKALPEVEMLAIYTYIPT